MPPAAQRCTLCLLPGGDGGIDHDLDVGMPSPQARRGEVDAMSWPMRGGATRRRMQSRRGGHAGRRAV